MTNLSELEKKYEELGAEIEALKNKEKGPHWEPELGGRYWTACIDGTAGCSIWADDDFDNHRLMLGLAFRTEEGAEYHLAMVKKAFEIRKAGREEFILNGANCAAVVNPERCIEYQEWYRTHSRRVYFDTEEECRKAFAGLSYEDVSYMISKGLV